MQVEPQTPLPAVYQITDHTDSSRDSYYVRATVRDSLSGSTIQAVNLASAGGGRYYAQFNAPADGTGYGRHIDITTTVYTDSLYSTKSELYAEVIERWFVKAQTMSFGGSSSSSSDIDYDALKKMISKILDEKIKGIKIPEALDLTNVEASIAGVLEAVNSIEMPEIPEPEKLDLQPVLQAVGHAHDSLYQKVSDIPEPNFEPIINAITKYLTEAIAGVESISKDQRKELAKTIDQTVRDIYKKNETKHRSVKEALKTILDLEDPDESVSFKPAADRPYSKLFSV